MNRRTVRFAGGSWLAAAGLIVVMLLAVGCAPITPEAMEADEMASATETPAPEMEAEAEIPTVTVEVTDAGITVPPEVPSGVVRFQFVTANPETMMPEVARLADGKTLDDLMTELAKMETEGPGPALAIAKLYGTLAGNLEAIYDLQPGAHVAIVGADSPNPVFAEFTAGEDSGATAPAADVAAQLDDFSFTLPDEIAAGSQVWQIENVGDQWHEMVIVDLNEGAAVEDIFTWMESMGPEGPTEPPPFTDVGLFGLISEGNRAWVTMDLPGGEYTVICGLPDILADMTPHMAKGMVRTLVVK